MPSHLILSLWNGQESGSETDSHVVRFHHVLIRELAEVREESEEETEKTNGRWRETNDQFANLTEERSLD